MKAGRKLLERKFIITKKRNRFLTALKCGVSSIITLYYEKLQRMSKKSKLIQIRVMLLHSPSHRLYVSVLWMTSPARNLIRKVLRSSYRTLAGETILSSLLM